mgnify:CR=1 FL=1
MNEHQIRLWRGMIDSIESYLCGETEDFYGIVGNLEGALDASETKNEALIEEWYEFWTPLEIRRAVEGNNVTKSKAIEELKSMKKFLQIKNVYIKDES